MPVADDDGRRDIDGYEQRRKCKDVVRYAAEDRYSGNGKVVRDEDKVDKRENEREIDAVAIAEVEPPPLHELVGHLMQVGNSC
ncbi:hypothetical protein [Candidatus Nitrososphaera sp. FF02]|uniref:hypothetical protein n=1 Tax=Candidatus Nitrososphaera sp. FF02 TaxID=3398226 RepID=UPI0039E98FDC